MLVPYNGIGGRVLAMAAAADQEILGKIASNKAETTEPQLKGYA